MENKRENGMENNKMTVPVNEQETHVYYMRDEKFAKVYTSDSTQITRFDKLCKTSPDMYMLIEDTSRGKMYRIADKSLVSFRKNKTKLNLSDEQLEALKNRAKNNFSK